MPITFVQNGKHDLLNGINADICKLDINLCNESNVEIQIFLIITMYIKMNGPFLLNSDFINREIVKVMYTRRCV